MRRLSSKKVVSSTPRADAGAGIRSHPIPNFLNWTSTVRPSSRGVSSARTEFLSSPRSTHSSFFAASFDASIDCRMRGRGRNGRGLVTPRMESLVV